MKTLNIIFNNEQETESFVIYCNMNQLAFAPVGRTHVRIVANHVFDKVNGSEGWNKQISNAQVY